MPINNVFSLHALTGNRVVWVGGEEKHSSIHEESGLPHTAIQATTAHASL